MGNRTAACPVNEACSIERVCHWMLWCGQVRQAKMQPAVAVHRSTAPGMTQGTVIVSSRNFMAAVCKVATMLKYRGSWSSEVVAVIS